MVNNHFGVKKYHDSLFQFNQMFHLNIQSAIFQPRKLKDKKNV